MRSAVTLVALLLGSASAATVQLCGAANYGSCGPEQNANPGQCYNVDSLYNDRVKSAHISGGNCVFWANANCQGDHTNEILGGTPDTGRFCSGGWQNRISSYKCCGDGAWCAGGTPKCT